MVSEYVNKLANGFAFITLDGYAVNNLGLPKLAPTQIFLVKIDHPWNPPHTLRLFLSHGLQNVPHHGLFCHSRH